MSIDWITVSAQIINFLVLVWLLKRFLYKPVLRAMDEREQRVTQRLRDADQREQQAEQQRQQYQQQQSEIESTKEALIKQAQEQAEEQRHQLLDDARAEVAKIRSSWLKQAELEKANFAQSLKQQTKNSVLSIAKNALHDLASANLELQLIESFISNLQQLDESKLSRFESLSTPFELKTSFATNQAQQEQLTQAIKSRFPNCAQLQFKQSSDFGFGLQLNAQEQRIDWNLEQYISELDHAFDKALTGGVA